MSLDFEKADELLRKAAEQGRRFLYEFEVYDLLRAIGLGKPPAYRLMRSVDEAPNLLDELDAQKLVLKIVHPGIVHKSDVGGVAIVDRNGAEETVRRILDEAPTRQAKELIERGEVPEEFADLPEDHFVERFIKQTLGVLAYPFVPGAPEFGRELFLGMRDTREFGPIINAGLGGINTELYSKEIQRGRAGVTICPGVSDEAEFFDAFRETVAHETIAGIARGHKRVVEDEKIIDILSRFHALVWRYSPLNPDAPYWLAECEINPFICDAGGLVPVDGLLRFTDVEPSRPDSPLERIHNLLRPKNICVIGVSGKGMNIGRVILRNLLKGDFTADRLAIVKPGDDEIDGVKCYPSIADLPGRFDMIVLSVQAGQVPEMVEAIIEGEKAESIILITGGMGEKEGAESLEDELRRIIDASRARADRGPVMVGGNSLGIISMPGGYDTMFVPPTKLPLDPDHPLGKKVALISQSGAFMISRMSKLGGMLPRYAISTGNQVDLGVADFVENLIDDPEVRVIGCYGEGLGRLEGLKLAEASRKLIADGRVVVVYKAGRSAEGRKAASGHTAAIAGDWDVAEGVLSRSGCMVANSFTEWQDLVMLAAALDGRPVGQGRLGAISNAGYETVGIADNLRGPRHSFELAQLSDATGARLADVLEQFHLGELVNIRNPIDITPMAVDRAHVEVVKAMAGDPGVDVIIHCCVPLSPQMKTREPGGPEGDGIEDPEAFTKLLIEAFKIEITKPMVVVLDAGELYDPMERMFIMAGIPVFRSADDAVRAFGRWVRARKHAEKLDAVL